MISSDEQLSLKELQQIPGVGKAISKDFYNVGIKSITDLRDRNPEELYERLCEYQGYRVDVCFT